MVAHEAPVHAIRNNVGVFKLAFFLGQWTIPSWPALSRRPYPTLEEGFAPMLAAPEGLCKNNLSGPPLIPGLLADRPSLW
jgi:hypothetical protein